MLAGPSEVLVIADDSCNPAWVAADLLSQAEHDRLAMSVLLTIGDGVLDAIQEEVSKHWLPCLMSVVKLRLYRLPSKALQCRVLICNSLAISNRYAQAP